LKIYNQTHLAACLFRIGNRAGSACPTLKDICDNQNAFGGNWSFSGGFRRILPVIIHGTRESIIMGIINWALF